MAGENLKWQGTMEMGRKIEIEEKIVIKENEYREERKLMKEDDGR